MKSNWIIFILLMLVSCKEVVKVSPLETQLKVINSSLPQLCKKDLTLYSKCWEQFQKEKLEYSIPPEFAAQALSYYQNKGYKVHLKNTNIVFDFKEEFGKNKIYQTKFISIELMYVLGLFSLLFSLMGLILYSARSRVIKIKKIYEKCQSDLHFWDKQEQDKLNSLLKSNRLPPYWIFNLNQTQDGIISISYYNGRSMGIIASDKESFYNSLKKYVRRKKD